MRATSTDLQARMREISSTATSEPQMGIAHCSMKSSSGWSSPIGLKRTASTAARLFMGPPTSIVMNTNTATSPTTMAMPWMKSE